jgi:hypothetical protein
VASDTRVRVEIAFDGGHALAVTVEPAAADELEQALAGSRDGVFELAADDARYLLPLKSVVYVKRFSRETPIGFGGTR